MKKNIEVDKREGEVIVEIEVPRRNYVKEPIISFRTKDIALLLEKEGIKVDSCVQTDTIYNDGRHPKTEGRWIFKLRKEKREQKKPNIKEVKTISSLTNENKPDKIVSKTKTSKKRK